MIRVVLFLLPFLLATQEALAECDWMSNDYIPPPDSLTFSGGVNPETRHAYPDRSTRIVTYDALGNKICEEVVARPPSQGEDPEYTVMSGSAPNREEEANRICNNSCEIHLPGSSVDMTDGEVVVKPDTSGQKKIFADPGDEGGYRCLVGGEGGTGNGGGEEGDDDGREGGGDGTSQGDNGGTGQTGNEGGGS